jgi:hypothetical protein
MPTSACRCTASKAFSPTSHLLQDPGDHRIQRQIPLRLDAKPTAMQQRAFELLAARQTTAGTTPIDSKEGRSA